MKSENAKCCAACGKQLARKRINGRLEDRGVFSRRKYCNRSCMALAMSQPAEQLAQVSLMKRARKFLKPCCEHCGTSQALQVHHKDRNRKNNEPENLETLCATCHMKMHHRNGDIVKRVERPPCDVCGKKSYRAGLCNTCRTRQRKYGSPLLTRRRLGSQWILIRLETTKDAPTS